MASDINVVVIVGRLVRDCETRVTSSGTSVCRFSIAVNRRKKTGESWTEEANFFDVVLFGKSADALKNYLVKGRQVSIEGELRQDRWEQDGQSRSRIEIFANNIQLLSGPGTGSEDSGSKTAHNIADDQMGPEAFEDHDDDIPF